MASNGFWLPLMASNAQVSSGLCCWPADKPVQHSAGEMLSSNYVKMLQLLLWPISKSKLLNHSCPLVIKGTRIAAFNFWEGLLCFEGGWQTSDVDRDGDQRGRGELQLSGQSHITESSLIGFVSRLVRSMRQPRCTWWTRRGSTGCSWWTRGAGWRGTRPGQWSSSASVA